MRTYRHLNNIYPTYSSDAMEVEENHLNSKGDENDGGVPPDAEDLEKTPKSSSYVSKSGDQVIQEVSPIIDKFNAKVATTQDD